MSIIDWIKNLFKKQTPVVAPAPSVVIPIKDVINPPWMTWMRLHIGEHEISGSKDNPFIMSLYQYANYPREHDETPWCAATVCAALQLNGYKDSNSAAAISYKNYGTACELKPGCIIVIEHSSGNHHVTFCDKIVSQDGKILVVDCLGGNQQNSLNVTRYVFGQAGGDKILATRWPVK